MSRNLSDDAQAYNACIDVLNARDAAIDVLLDERDRAWRAAEALYPNGRHGNALNKAKGRRLAIGPVVARKRT